MKLRKLIESDPELQKILATETTWDSKICRTTWTMKFSPLHFAACFGHVWLIKILVQEFAACIDLKQNLGTWIGTPLLLAISRNQQAAVETLLAYGADARFGGVHYKGEPFLSAIQYADFLGDRDQIKEVLQEKKLGICP